MSSKSEREFKKWASKKLLRSLEKNKHETLQELYNTMHDEAPRELLEAYKYESQADDRVCERCAPLHGMIFSVLDEAHLPPIHPDCRCFAKLTMLDPITMQESTWGGEVIFTHKHLAEVEYGTIDGTYREAVGFIERTVGKMVQKITDAVIELIDEHFS